MRDQNDAISQALAGFDHAAGPFGFLCECTADDCHEMAEIALKDYHYVRSDPSWKLVVPHHVESPAEVVERHRTWWVVSGMAPLGDAMGGGT